jgi:tetratricopeptide (TPR) repeat protein
MHRIIKYTFITILQVACYAVMAQTAAIPAKFKSWSDKAIQEKLFGKEHPLSVDAYNNTGRALAAKGQYDKALEYYNIALAINEKILGKDGVTPHIYGKKQTRPFRKMGHVTIVNQDIDEARRVAEEVKNTIRVISE